MALPFPAFLGASELGLPPLPDEAIWPYLDAAARCIERFGWSRTTVKDIAAEAGVERTTVYRRVGSMDEVFRLLIAREIHLLIATIPAPAPGDAEGPDIVVELLASAVEQWSAHPLIIKVMTDEPDLATRFLTGAIPEAIRRIGVTLEPGLAAAMDLGLIARRDPIVLGEWLARIGISLLVAPSPGDLRTFLHEILDPALRVVTTEPVGLQ